MITRIIVLLAIVMITVSCATVEPQPPSKLVVYHDIDGVLTQISPHPCEGNWNFCDYNDIEPRELIIPAE